MGIVTTSADTPDVSKVHVKKERTSDDNALKIMAKKFTMNDIKVDGKLFRSTLIPTYFDIIMTQDSPFKTRETYVLNGLQEVWNKMFPESSERLSMDCAVKYVVSNYPYMVKLAVSHRLRPTNDFMSTVAASQTSPISVSLFSSKKCNL